MAKFSMSLSIEMPEQVLLLFLFAYVDMQIQCMLRSLQEADNAVAFVQSYKFTQPAGTTSTEPDNDDDKGSESSFAFHQYHDTPLPA